MTDKIEVKPVDGGFVVSEGGTWLPGIYETKRAAEWAARLPPDDLDSLWQTLAFHVHGNADGTTDYALTEMDVGAPVRILRSAYPGGPPATQDDERFMPKIGPSVRLFGLSQIYENVSGSYIDYSNKDHWFKDAALTQPTSERTEVRFIRDQISGVARPIRDTEFIGVDDAGRYYLAMRGNL